MERILALYDSDVFYATRFLEYFKKKKEYGFEITVFTKSESLQEFLLLHHIDILLIGDQINAKEFSKDGIKYIYKLTEDFYSVEDEYPCIRKYQPAQAVMTEILTDYRKRENEKLLPSSTGQGKLISIFSAVPNLESVSFAWSYGALLSENKKALLILLEPLPVPWIALADKDKGQLTEMIYYLKENKEIIARMNMLLRFQGNLAYLTGVIHGFDILSLSREDIRSWVDELTNHTDYQTVIFYIGCYTDAMNQLMEASHFVMVTGTEASYEEAVRQEWKKQMVKSGVDTQQSKYIHIHLQKEDKLGAVPKTLEELSQTSIWMTAKQYLTI